MKHDNEDLQKKLENMKTEVTAIIHIEFSDLFIKLNFKSNSLLFYCVKHHVCVCISEQKSDLTEKLEKIREELLEQDERAQKSALEMQGILGSLVAEMHANNTRKEKVFKESEAEKAKIAEQSREIKAAILIKRGENE